MGNPGGVGGVGGTGTGGLEGLDGLDEVGGSGGGGSAVEAHDHEATAAERTRGFHSRAVGEAALRGRLEELLGDDAEAEGTDGTDGATATGGTTGPDPAEVRRGAESGLSDALRSVGTSYRGDDRTNARAWLDALRDPLEQGLGRITDPRPGQPRTTYVELDGADPADLGERLAEALNREYEGARPPIPITASFSGDRLTLTSSMEGARTDVTLD